MSKAIEDALAVLTAEVDQALKLNSDGNPAGVRALALANKGLRDLAKDAEKKRRPKALRDRIDAQRQRVRKALGFK